MNFLENFTRLVLEDPLFFISSSIILLSALLAVSLNNLIRAGLALTACFLGVSLLYFKLEVLLLAIAQVVIYAVGISLLIVFSMMLLKQAKEIDLPAELKISKTEIQAITLNSILVAVFLIALTISLVLFKNFLALSNLAVFIGLVINSLILALVFGLLIFFVILNIRENQLSQSNFSRLKLTINREFLFKDVLKSMLALLSALCFYGVLTLHVLALDQDGKLALLSKLLLSEQTARQVTKTDQFIQIAQIFFSKQAVSFEVVSVLLLIALLIAISISRKEREECSN